MILKSSYRDGSVVALANYIGRAEGEGYEIKGMDGHVLDSAEKKAFIERGEHFNFERHFIMSPDDRNISQENLDKYTREAMSEWMREEKLQTVSYVYSTHFDQGNIHSHVALIGEKRELTMYKKDLDRTQNQSMCISFHEDPKNHRGLYLDNPIVKTQGRWKDGGRQQERGKEDRHYVSERGPEWTSKSKDDYAKWKEKVERKIERSIRQDEIAYRHKTHGRYALSEGKKRWIRAVMWKKAREQRNLELDKQKAEGMLPQSQGLGFFEKRRKKRELLHQVQLQRKERETAYQTQKFARDMGREREQERGI